MAVQRYPTGNFPLPMMQAYSYGIDMGIKRTSIKTGIPRQRRAYKTMPHFFSLEFPVPVDSLWQWQTWINIYAYKWFELPLVNAATHGEPLCSNFCIVRFVSDLDVSVMTQKVLSVKVSAELAPGQLVY